MMKRFILIILAISIQMQAFGQMFPTSDHSVFNALSINPAFAGCQDALSATILYRNQWAGIKDAPKSYMLSVHAPVDNDRIGLGLLVEKNSIGIFNETNLIGNYAYRMEMLGGRLALGLGFGVTIYNNAWNELVANDANDAQLLNNTTTAVLPAFSLGGYYYTKKYFIGISMPLFLGHELDKTTGKYKVIYNFSGVNYFLSGGYELALSPNMKLMPSLLIKYHPNNVVQIDYNAQLNLRDKFWLGIGYRSKGTIIGMLQCQLTYQIRMGYSHDFDLGTLGSYKNGSHEIILNYIFKYSRKVIGPRQF